MKAFIGFIFFNLANSYNKYKRYSIKKTPYYVKTSIQYRNVCIEYTEITSKDTILMVDRELKSSSDGLPNRFLVGLEIARKLDLGEVG